MKSSKKLDTILDKKKRSSCELIEVLQDIQAAFHYLPEGALKEVAVRLDVPPIEVFRVANFYKAFTLNPRGKHLLTVCTGTACHVREAPKLLDELLGMLNVKPGETTEDKQFTVEAVNCLGACALGPVIVMDGKYYKHMTAAKLRAVIEKVKKSPSKKKKKT